MYFVVKSTILFQPIIIFSFSLIGSLGQSFTSRKKLTNFQTNFFIPLLLNLVTKKNCDIPNQSSLQLVYDFRESLASLWRKWRLLELTSNQGTFMKYTRNFPRWRISYLGLIILSIVMECFHYSLTSSLLITELMAYLL